MVRRPEDEFTWHVKLQALCRQDFLCASCASLIVPFSDRKLRSVAWGESAHAHHRRPMGDHGRGTVGNCVVICESCHYSAHFGGDYKNRKDWGRVGDFPYFHGTKGRRDPT